MIRDRSIFGALLSTVPAIHILFFRHRMDMRRREIIDAMISLLAWLVISPIKNTLASDDCLRG